MYGGRVAEAGPTAEVFARPAHPYTAALMAAAAGNERPGQRLEPIPGAPPTLTTRCGACAFAPRCPMAERRCHEERPEDRVLDGRQVACHRAEAMLAAPEREAAP
jgi:oligopeptide/dipeptide ABC transporter ATP-binding protein